MTSERFAALGVLAVALLFAGLNLLALGVAHRAALALLAAAVMLGAFLAHTLHRKAVTW